MTPNVGGERSHPVDPSVDEAAGWAEIHELMSTLRPEEAGRTGYFEEGWSAKDLLGHIGTWLAEAGVILERIGAGTYRREEIDVDALNQRFLEAMRDVPYGTVRAQASAARERMLRAWRSLPQHSADADFWIAKSGAEHYAEHLPRLREWVEQLRSA